MTDREVMQMALDALEKHVHEYEAIEALRTALAQPEPDQDGFVFIEARWGKDFFEIQVPDCIGEIVRIYHKQWRGESQPEQEPVAVWELQEGGWDTIADADWMETLPIGTKLYAAPPQRESTCAECDKKQSDGWALYCVGCLREFYKDDPTNKREWVGLTDKEAKKTFEKHNCTISADLAGILARAITATLKEKNNG